jgi:hypothetical protein
LADALNPTPSEQGVDRKVKNGADEVVGQSDARHGFRALVVCHAICQKKTLPKQKDRGQCLIQITKKNKKNK